MTYADVLKTVLKEVAGLPADKIDFALNIAREKQPNSKLDIELSPEEAERLLAELRKEGPGILAWLVRGAMEVFKNSGTA